MISCNQGDVKIHGNAVDVVAEMSTLILSFIQTVGEEAYILASTEAVKEVERRKKANANRGYHERKKKRKE